MRAPHQVASKKVFWVQRWDADTPKYSDLWMYLPVGTSLVRGNKSRQARPWERLFIAARTCPWAHTHMLKYQVAHSCAHIKVSFKYGWKVFHPFLQSNYAACQTNISICLFFSQMQQQHRYQLCSWEVWETIRYPAGSRYWDLISLMLYFLLPHQPIFFVSLPSCVNFWNVFQKHS